MTYIEAPTEFGGGMPSIFLAGGITDCPDWQADALSYLDGPDIAVLNPRRADFPIHDPSASEAQIDWEYRHLRLARVVLFWFAGSSSIQPIALYELGAHATAGKPLAVGCDPTYLRRADVFYQLALVRPELTVFDSLTDTCQAAADLLAHGWSHCRHCGIFIRRSAGPSGWWRGVEDDGSLLCAQTGKAGPHEPRSRVTDMNLDRISWSHPRLGRISEIACQSHAGEVLAALKTLGIGCAGEPAAPGDTCLRCAHTGQRAFMFLPAAVVSPT